MKDKKDSLRLKENLHKLNQQQLKFFFGILVHGWASRNAFINTQNFRNLWCELNKFCAEADEGFPEPYDDYELLCSFCQAHPYYFIDILSHEVIRDLFCEYLDDRLDILATTAQKLHTEGFRTAYAYTNEALGMTEDIDESIAQAEKHVRMFS